MNLLDAYVTKILSAPYSKYDVWWLDVEYSCEGHPGKSSLMFNTVDEAQAVKIGYKFQT